MKGVSVVICCYNSVNRITQTLEYLSRQRIKETIDWEVVLVDNNCSDNTVDLAQDCWKNLGYVSPLRIVKEVQPGLSHARSCGVFYATYDYIVFCDDDNWLCENYIETVYRVLSNNPQLAAVGGRTEANFEIGVVIPDWFKSEQSKYAIGTQGVKSSIVTNSRGYLWGAGLAFRKIRYTEAINKDFPAILKDRTGKTLNSGGDTELCLRWIIMGYDLYYEETLSLIHFIPNERLTEAYRSDLNAGLQESMFILRKYYAFINCYLKSKNRDIQRIKWVIKYYLSIIFNWPKDQFSWQMISIYTRFNSSKIDSDSRSIYLFFASKKESSSLFQHA